MSATVVTITSVTESESRRRRLLSKKVVVTYEVKVKGESAATTLVTKMNGSNFAAALKSEVATALNVDKNSITLSAREPTVNNSQTVSSDATGITYHAFMGAVLLLSYIF